MKLTNPLSSLSRFLFKRVLYLDREPWLLEWNNREGAPTVTSGSSIRLDRKIYAVIIGKTLYHESAKSFPIKSYQDVKKAIELQGAELCPFEYGKFYARVFPDGENQSISNAWFIKPEALERIAEIRPYFVFPETALLAGTDSSEITPEADPQSYGGGSLMVVDKGNRLLLGFVNRKGICSSIEAPVSQNNDPVRTFRRMIGFEANSTSERRIPFPGEFLRRLYKSILDLGPRDLLRFRFDDPFHLEAAQKTMLIRGALTSTALLALYVILVSGMLVSAERRLESEYKGKESILSQYARMEDDIKKKSRLYQDIEGITKRGPSKITLLNILNEKIPEMTTISSLKVSDREVELKAVAPRAIELMDALNSAPQIENVRFTSGIQKVASGDDKGAESFSIGFRLK